MIFVAFIQENLNYFGCCGISQKKNTSRQGAFGVRHTRRKKGLVTKFPSKYKYIPKPDYFNFFKNHQIPCWLSPKRLKSGFFLEPKTNTHKMPRDSKITGFQKKEANNSSQPSADLNLNNLSKNRSTLTFMLCLGICWRFFTWEIFQRFAINRYKFNLCEFLT